MIKKKIKNNHVRHPMMDLKISMVSQINHSIKMIKKIIQLKIIVRVLTMKKKVMKSHQVMANTLTLKVVVRTSTLIEMRAK